MVYRVLADFLVVVHLCFVLFVVAGGFLCVRRPILLVAHLPAAAWGIAIELGNWTCPLTPLEVHLRRLGGEAGYSGGFVAHYLLPLLYPPGLTREVQFALAGLVALVNLAAYFWLSWRFLRGRKRTGSRR